MDDFALTPAQRGLFHALDRRGIPFLIVGIGAAALQGAPLVTQDLAIGIDFGGRGRFCDRRVRPGTQKPHR